ncbi:MAG: acetyl-CoA hydrolase/transferase family protein [Dehalococcoidia bacterium]
MSGRIEEWPDAFASKLMPAAEAAKLVQSGDTICIPTGALVPTVTAAIFARASELHDVDVFASAPVTDPGWWQPGHPSFRMHIETFSTPASRAAISARQADFTSVPFTQRFKPGDERGTPVHHPDVALVALTPPDHLGFCSFGMGVWNGPGFAKRAKTVIAEMHASYPRTHGEGRLHVSEVAAFVEAGPLPERRAIPVADDYPMQLGAFVNELVRDGDTIQVGTGGLTNGLPAAGAFAGKQELGVHAELSVPGMVRLVREGVITGSRKTLHPGKYVTTQLEASGEGDIDFINDNPIFALYDVSYVNNPIVIAQNENIICINNALAIDFTGQITAESIGAEMWSGPGGQQDFAIGALMAKGGRNVTILRSVAVGGTVSRIMPRLPEGTIITVPRQMADYVITEYGIARLFGKSDRERAEELISIAHPDHRGELRKALERR